MKKFGHLSNVEMKDLLELHRKRPSSTPGRKAFMSWVHQQTLAYLHTTPVSNQTVAQTRAFVVALKELRDGTVYVRAFCTLLF